MSETTNRQAYVFLKEGDVIQEGDEWYYDCTKKWLKVSKTIGTFAEKGSDDVYRRPITLPTEQTDKMTVWDEYAKIYFKYSIEKGFGKTVTANDAKEYADAMMKARAQK